jgi:two-component system, NtrC family, sensor kinase
LKDHSGKVVGIIYVGAKQASFQGLLNSFNQRILLVALGTILLTIFITVPVSQRITNPLNQLKVLVDANRRVGSGDMSVRVPVEAGGEVGLLGSSFNSMLDTLQITQDQLVQSEKLASLGQLAAGVAHELNNPLGTILLYSDILLKEMSPDSPIQKDLEVIVNETKRCKGIVAALLEFARQNQVIAQPTDLNAVVREAVDCELKQHKNHPIDVVDTLNPDLPTIQADTSQIYQVVVNLVENAIDAMPEGGTLTLVTHLGPPGMVTFELQDTGVGISAENYPKLFTPFFTTKPMGKGTGLGLAIVYGIIKLHRGQINVHSELGVGTRITIQLPIKLVGAVGPNSSVSRLIKSK